jgi:hypothetical protein
MHSLEVIKSMNNRPVAQHETETTRHCSYTKSAQGVVLHSAKQRSTVFLSGADATRFIGWAKNCTVSGLDRLIESYF